MEYPATLKEARKAMQGKWRTNGISFSIKGNKMSDIVGPKDVHGNDYHQLTYSLNFVSDHWQLYNSVFGMGAKITQWSDDSFTTTELAVIDIRKGLTPVKRVYNRA